MYPNLYFALKEWFGVEWQWTKIFNSFGLLLAISFVCAAVVLYREFKRKEAQGLLKPTPEAYIAGEPASIPELIVQFIVGFLIGFKIIGGIIDGGLMQDAPGYIGSKQGNILAGLALGAFFTFLKWREKDKQKLAVPEKKVQQVYPHHRVGDFTILAAVAGLIGAKVFHFFENWSSFVKDPWGNIASPAGLTFYGGLIVAAVVLFWYAHKKKIGWKYLVDSVGPGLMIAYAVGRLGCQVSGDGDWGIYNSAYASTPDGKVVLADSTNNFEKALHRDSATSHYFARDMQEFGKIPHKAYVAPSFLPIWMVAMNYTHNVNEDGVAISNCKDKYCTMLPVPVFPTPLYEFAMCTILFFILWAIRKKISTPGVLFGIYLMMNGAERFLIEKIRVNTQYHFLGLHPSQAEIISIVLFLTGIVVIWYCKKTDKARTAVQAL
jgi:phosphatidylglycerol---prolipoprotein diacylglyceryl transferase